MHDTSAVAISLLQQGDLDGAQALFEFGLHQNQARLGEHHPALANDFANLGNLLAERGNFGDAVPMLWRAHALHEKALGAAHPEVAVDLGNIGLVLVEMRDYPGARGPFERALRIQLAAFGPDHPHVATALANLATLERCEGHADLARTLLERALAIFTARLGEQNSATRIVRGALQGIDASR